MQLRWSWPLPPSYLNERCTSGFLSRLCTVTSAEACLGLEYLSASLPAARVPQRRLPVLMRKNEVQVTWVVVPQSSNELVNTKRMDAGSSHVEFSQGIIYEDNEMEEAVRAGSLEALVDNLTRPDKLDAAFNRAFLTTYSYFASGEDVLHLLMDRFDCLPPETLSPTKRGEWIRETKPVIQLRVANVLRQWLESFWMEPPGPETHRNLLKLHLFVSESISNEASAGQQLLAIVQSRLSGGERVKRSQPSFSSAPKPILPRKLDKLQFLKIDATEIARQLTLMEASVFAKVRPTELLNKNWQKKESEDEPTPAPNVRELIRLFNQLSSWVAAVIIAESDLKKRTQIIGHLVNVANACHELQNYSAVISILSGLESAPVYRLARTWAMVTERTCSILEPLQALTATDQNYQSYRDALRCAVPPCIPFLGLFLKDLVFIEEGNQALTPEGLINFTKYSMLASTIHEVQRFQQVPYCLQPVPEIQEYLSAQFQSTGDVHELWERSCQLDPRGRGDGSRSRDTYTATGGMTTSMVVACMILDD